MIEDSSPEQKPGLSDYSRKLSNDVKEALYGYFRAYNEDKKELDEFELACETINKRFIATCLISIFSDMSANERKAFKDQSLDIACLAKVAMDKLNLSKEDKESIEGELKKITPEIAQSSSKLLKELNLRDHDSPLYKLKKDIYDSLQEKSEAAEAYSYLNFTT